MLPCGESGELTRGVDFEYLDLKKIDPIQSCTENDRFNFRPCLIAELFKQIR